jgi:tetratricopeptide (TPR) repeat protein
MNGKKRIQPYKDHKDGEYLPLLDFVSKNVMLLEPGFRPTKNLLQKNERQESVNTYTTAYTFGTMDEGFIVLHYERFDEKKNKVVDKITVKAFGLKNKASFELESTRDWNEENYLEIRLKGDGVAIEKIMTNFIEQFKPKKKDAFSESKFSEEKLEMVIQKQTWDVVQVMAQELLKNNPLNIKALFALGLSHAARGDYIRAQYFLKKVTIVNRHHLEAIFNLALIYKIRKEYSKAITTLQKLIQLYPEHKASYQLLEEIHSILGNKQELSELNNQIQIAKNTVQPITFLTNSN